MINIGSNKFEKVTIPIAVEDRYFLLEEENSNDIWTVLTFVDGKPIIEILRNAPKENPVSSVTTNPTGVVTVSDPTTGNFLYKLRPGAKNSSIFGSLQGVETEIKITDREIRVETNVFQNNMIVGSQVGIKIDKNGGIAMGTGLPPEFQKIIGT